jgi:hypothetical protein
MREQIKDYSQVQVKIETLFKLLIQTIGSQQIKAPNVASQ